MGFSMIDQIGFLLGIKVFSAGLEFSAFVASIVYLFKNHLFIRKSFKNSIFFIQQNRFASTLFFIIWSLMATRAFFALPETVPILEFTAGFQSAPHLPPLNTLVLGMCIPHINTGFGNGFFSFFSYLSLGFSTYALARRYAWPSTAVTVSLVVLSMPRLIGTGFSAGHEIIPAATTAFAVLEIYRFVEKPHIIDLALFLSASLFTIAEAGLGLTIPIILFILFGVIVFRRHGLIILKETLYGHRQAVFYMVPPLLIFAQIPVFAVNIRNGFKWHCFFGYAPFSYNQEGLAGALANLIQYGFQIFRFALPLKNLSEWWSAVFTKAAPSGWHTISIFFSKYAVSVSNILSMSINSRNIGFGPLAIWLILPGLVYALVKGPRRLKAMAVGLAGYIYIMAFMVAWHPENIRFFTPFFSCAGFTVAFLLPPWRLSRFGRKLLQALCGFIFCYGFFLKQWTI